MFISVYSPISFDVVVLRPGFEPGSVTREATILDRTILPEHQTRRVHYKVRFNKNSVHKNKKAQNKKLCIPPAG